MLCHADEVPARAVLVLPGNIRGRVDEVVVPGNHSLMINCLLVTIRGVHLLPCGLSILIWQRSNMASTPTLIGC